VEISEDKWFEGFAISGLCGWASRERIVGADFRFVGDRRRAKTINRIMDIQFIL